MDFHVSLAGRGDLSARIYRQLHEAIIDGRLAPGERLPPTRELATSLAVSRNTVAVAYERLTAEGFLVGRVGAGTFVCANPPGPPARPGEPGGDIPVRPVWRALAGDPPRARPAVYDFRLGVPDAHRFPMAAWRRLVARELSDVGVLGTGYVDPAGHAGLRAAIAKHIGLSRSVRTVADDVIVTHGAQQAIDLVGRVLLEPGGCVAVEEPGYPPVRGLFTSLGAKVVGVPVDAEGIVVPAIPRAARLVYVTPSHQFPLGTAMSLDRRTALLAWARRRGAVLVEDDYDSEFRFSDRPLEPLHSLDHGRRVVYVGSFAKTMLPMLRLGFLVVPPALGPAVRAAKRLTDRQGEIASQGAMAAFLTEGLFARHLRRSTREYAARHERIAHVLRRDFADRLEVVPSIAGLHLAARSRGSPGVGVDIGTVVRRAAEVGVAVESLADYYGEGPGEPGLALGYGAIELDRIEPGLSLLAGCWR
ncbi:MAG: aminotransferase class I/II-fold pyridoxal phosphate-dependent enzyme [Actinophytocola sp.]|uniref:MocR-like pyridoxine biosynthesis transcription factor PdxR n=1 Tax=Actinophytocola sp. TaxID=1872138 RepID=UPI00132BAC8A|nr:PLP-dependent aminotransferase family protein [Actinophytocola sp.]MPZ82740.1 aminotransferase class I/II-fold pyridoxal phosphate-dependent enzyme [Actinophytocola sp.]